MEGAPRLKKHDNVQKQMSTYERLLQHAMNKFSKEKLYNMLRLVTHESASQKQQISNHGARPKGSSCKISSIARLREIVSNVYELKRKGLTKEEETQVVKYFETFFHDLSYMQELKKQFDEKIYACLYDQFYDPADDLEVPKQRSAESMDDSDSGHVTDEDRPYNPPSNAFNNDSIWDVNLDIMTNKQKLAYAVREMYRVNQKWDALLSEQELDLNQFDPDSHHELLQFTGYSNFEAILRLFPDIFVKSYKSIEMAKLWWTQANKLYPDLPAKGKTSQDFSKRVSALQEKMALLAAEISRDEARLSIQQDDIEGLKSRDDRFDYLNLTQEEVENLQHEVNVRYQDILEERDSLRDRMYSVKRGSAEYKETKRHLADCDQQLEETEDELRLLSYHMRILQEDYQVELQMRPDMIRFLGSAEEQIEELQETVSEKKWEKRQTEKTLVLIRTNREKMREIMRKYTKGSSKSATPPQEEEEEIGDSYETDDSKDRKTDRNKQKQMKTNKISYKPALSRPDISSRQQPQYQKKTILFDSDRQTSDSDISTIPIDEDTDESNDLDSPVPTNRTYGVRESSSLGSGFHGDNNHDYRSNQSRERSRIPRPKPVTSSDW